MRIAHADSRHRVIDLKPPCPCLGREGGRVRCAVVSIVARGPTSAGSEGVGCRATDVRIAASLPKDGSVRLPSHTPNCRLNVCWNAITICTPETLGATLIV